MIARIWQRVPPYPAQNENKGRSKLIVDVLIGNAAIREAIQTIMRPRDARKVVVVAFVGTGATSYILGSARQATRLQVICWDKEGCTSPEEIRLLRQRGAAVRFAQNLHMKLYWAQGHGAVIGSANLSNNGLGDGGLHELAVRVDPHDVDIRAILGGIDSRPVTDVLLDDLFRRTADYRRRNNGSDVFDRARQPQITFDTWLLSRRPSWKFFAYREYYEEDPVALVQNEALVFRDCEDFWSGPSWHTTPSEWLLHVDINNWDIRWAMADHQMAMARHDPNRAAPAETHYAVQMTKDPGIPPFRITPAFRRAVRQFVESEGIKSFEDCVRYTQAHDGTLSRAQLARLSNIYQRLPL